HARNLLNRNPVANEFRVWNPRLCVCEFLRSVLLLRPSRSYTFRDLQCFAPEPACKRGLLLWLTLRVSWPLKPQNRAVRGWGSLKHSQPSPFSADAPEAGRSARSSFSPC